MQGNNLVSHPLSFYDFNLNQCPRAAIKKHPAINDILTNNCEATPHDVIPPLRLMTNVIINTNIIPPKAANLDNIFVHKLTEHNIQHIPVNITNPFALAKFGSIVASWLTCVRCNNPAHIKNVPTRRSEERRVGKEC